jgi:hypothetical protein
LLVAVPLAVVTMTWPPSKPEGTIARIVVLFKTLNFAEIPSIVTEITSTKFSPWITRTLVGQEAFGVKNVIAGQSSSLTRKARVLCAAPGVLVGVSVGVFVGGTGVFVGVSVGVFVGGTGVLVGVAVGVLVGVAVGVLVGVAVGVFVGVSVGVAVGVFVGVLVGVSVGVAVGGTGVFVGVSVGVAVGGTGVFVGVFVAVFVGATGVCVGELVAVTQGIGVALVGIATGAGLAPLLPANAETTTAAPTAPASTTATTASRREDRRICMCIVTYLTDGVKSCSATLYDRDVSACRRAVRA